MSSSSISTTAVICLIILSVQLAVGFTNVGSSRAIHCNRNCDVLTTSTIITSYERDKVSTTRHSNDVYSYRNYNDLRARSEDAVEANVDTKGDDELTEEEIDESMEYLANLIKAHLASGKAAIENDATESDTNDGNNSYTEVDNSENDSIGYQLAKGRFIDLTTTIEGEQLLENLFFHTTSSPNHNNNNNERILKHAITTLQSLLIYGIQIGVKGSEETQQRMVRHLFRAGDAPAPPSGTWISPWNADCIRRLKFFRDTSLGKMLLAKLIRKRTAQGAFDLLVEMGVWDRHVDTPLLRSGFPVRFLESELTISKEAEGNEHDPDAVLGIRRDLREMKVYTIDSASTMDIDDGIAVEVLKGEDGAERHRYWIHIADVDRFAPRGSELLGVAERRGTSLYLPTMTLCMFPPK